MNRPWLRLYLTLMLFMFLWGCSTPKKHDDEIVKIVTTIHPYQLIVQQIAGSRAEVVTFIPGNASPHTYAPTPKDVQRLHDADLVIANGLNLEVNMITFLKELGDKVMFAADFIQTDKLVNDDEINFYNPHIWTNPDFIFDIAVEIEKRMEVLRPGDSQYFRENLLQLQTELLAADQKIRSERSKYGELGIMTYHDSYRYFNDKYGIRLIGAIESSPGKEPSPKALVELGKNIKLYNVHSIYIEPQLNPKSAEVLSKEYNLAIVKYDPIGTTLEAKTISEFLLKNWELLKKGF